MGSESSALPTVAELVRPTRIAFAVPASPRRHTPVPGIIIGPWDLYGPVDRPPTIASFFEDMLGDNEPDTSDQPEEHNH